MTAKNLTFILILLAALVIPASASETPVIISWGNDKTNDDDTNLTLNAGEAVEFNATANQWIDRWNWYANEIRQDTEDEVEGRHASFEKRFSSGTYVVKVNATNDNGTSNTISWNVKVARRDVELTNISSLTYTVDPGTNATYILNLTNRGDDADSFTLSIDNTEEASIASLDIPSPVFLDAGQSKVFHLNISDTSSGIFHVKVTARSMNDSSKMDYVNTITRIDAQDTGHNAPGIISWTNDKTNNNDLIFNINASETVKFMVTANQTITSWMWKLDGTRISNPYDNLTYTFYENEVYTVSVIGSNANGTTGTVTWRVSAEKENKKPQLILYWSPEAVVDYVYVNETEIETIEYSITTAEPMTMTNWTVNGVPYSGSSNGDNTYYYLHTWDNESRGFNTIIFKGSNADSQVEFRWYVNVYRNGINEGGNLFDTIDEALTNHATEIKIRMFKYKVAKKEGNQELAAEKVNQLHDEIAQRQMTREALRLRFKEGKIGMDEYAAEFKQVQRDARYNIKLAKDLAEFTKEIDEKSSKEFDRISRIENEHTKEKKGKQKTSRGKEKDNDKGKEGSIGRAGDDD